MQFGIFTVGDVTTDPTTGRTPTEHERIKAQVEIAKKAEDVGLDVVAVGQHHNPPFVASSPTTTMAWIAAQTDGALLVVRHGRTTKDQLHGAVERLAGVNAHALGVVFNMTPRKSGRGGYGYGYGYTEDEDGQKTKAPIEKIKA